MFIAFNGAPFLIVRVMAVSLSTLLLSCHSESSDPTVQVDYISSDEEARALLDVVHRFWEYSAKPAMPHQSVWPEQAIVVDQEIVEYTGNAHLKGNVKFYQYGSSTATSSEDYLSTVTNITSIFDQTFSFDEVKINGTVKYDEIYSGSRVCTYSFVNGTMNCYGTTNISLAITTVNKLNVEFDYQEKKIKDDVTIDAKKEALGWDVTIINKNGSKFKFSY